jgi:hypothetical protein
MFLVDKNDGRNEDQDFITISVRVGGNACRLGSSCVPDTLPGRCAYFSPQFIFTQYFALARRGGGIGRAAVLNADS